MLRLFNILFVTVTLALATSTYADDESVKGVENLSPELRSLFSEEMIAIQSGMMSIVSAYAAGNFDEIASIAESIENSYILRQNMSQQQMHELHKKLPSSFIDLDQRFHNYAGLLAGAANRNNGELVGFYFSKLVESCSGCHSAHAKHKFPAFAERNQKNTHSH